jgi:membrane protein
VIVAVWRAVRGFYFHRGLFLAAGLSFYFLICLIPMLLLLVSVLGFVLTDEGAAQAVLKQLGQLVPVYRRELNEILERIIATRKLSGLLGTAILLLFSTQLFASLRMVMNDVFAVKRGRGFFHGMLYDVMMVLVMGALFLASILVSDGFFWIRTVLTPGLMPRQWVRWTLVAISLTFNFVLFFMTYRYFPNRHVRLGAVIGGAVLASGLWEVAKQIFRWYILSVGVYDQIYGPLGALVALSMFTYYSGIVVVLGAEYAAALEARWRARS